MNDHWVVPDPYWESLSPVLRPQNYFSARDRELARSCPDNVQDRKSRRGREMDASGD